LAVALAALASSRISPRVVGLAEIENLLEFSEFRLHAKSTLVGKTIGEAGVHQKTGASIVGLWGKDRHVFEPVAGTKLEVGAILLAVGTREALRRLEALAVPLRQDGTIVVIGAGEVGQRICQCLRAAGEAYRVVERKPGPDVDIVGDALDATVLERANIAQARAVILALDSGSPTALAAALIRDLAPHTPIIARVNRNQDLLRVHRAGADFALSFTHVVGQLLAKRLELDEGISLDSDVRLIATRAKRLEDVTLAQADLEGSCGCSIVAIRRGPDVLCELTPDTMILPSDDLYVCGTVAAIGRFTERFC
jgi:Trk K+ transport system NAD-binding subunit